MVVLIASPDVFKTLVLLVSILGVCPLIGPFVDRYLKLFHVYAAVVLMIDLLGERRIFHNYGRTIFYIFAVCGVITLLDNRNLLNFSGLSNFCYLMEALALVYSYGKDSRKHNRWSSAVVCSLIFITNIIGIWMFYTKFHLNIPGRGYIGMYPSENRLAGLFGNPNVMGMICLVGVCLSLIQLVCSSRNAGRMVYGVFAAIDIVALLLTNSRTQIYSLILLVGVVTFMLWIRNRKSVKGVCLGIVVAVAMLVVSFGCSKLLQLGLAKFDINYSYYEMYIVNGGGKEYESAGESDTEPTSVENKESTEDVTEQENSFVEEPSTEPVTEEPTVSADEVTVQQTNSVAELGTEPVPTETMEQDDKAAELTENPGSTIQRDTGFAGMNGRLDIWMKGVKLFLHKPLTGWGMDNLDYALREIGVDGYFVRGNLHNTYLDVLVDFGILGFACLMAYLLLMLSRVIAFFRNNKGDTWYMGTILLGCVAAFLLDAVADSTLLASVYPTSIGFWMIASRFAGLMDEESKDNGIVRQEPIGRLFEAILNRLGKKR